MKRKVLVFLLTVVAIVLCGCVEIYTAEDMMEAKQQGYNEGYECGYHSGKADQREEDYDAFLIDGMSIRNIVEKVYNEYGITPSKAFSICDEYEYDSNHGGITWDEYQNAINAIYYTADLFPSD